MPLRYSPPQPWPVRICLANFCPTVTFGFCQSELHYPSFQDKTCNKGSKTRLHNGHHCGGVVHQHNKSSETYSSSRQPKVIKISNETLSTKKISFPLLFHSTNNNFQGEQKLFQADALFNKSINFKRNPYC